MSSIVVFLSLLIFTASSSEVKVRPGEDAVLQCRGPRGANITLLEWLRPELQLEGYVFFFQDQRPYENYHHESFKGRVQLRDPSMKDGDVSVVLKNAGIRDTGTYECHITTSDTRSGERVIAEFKHSVNLTVTASGFTDEETKDGGDKDGGDKDGRDKDKAFPVIISVSVLAVLLLVIVTVAVNKHRNGKEKSKRKLYERPPC